MLANIFSIKKQIVDLWSHIIQIMGLKKCFLSPVTIPVRYMFAFLLMLWFPTEIFCLFSWMLVKIVYLFSFVKWRISLS